MIAVSCPNSGVTTYHECACPAELLNAGFHHPDCAFTDLDSRVKCPPEAGCCAEDHDHAAAANACEGGHGRCKSGGKACLTLTGPGEACPGGHCSLEDPDCAVCHPLVITMLPGSAAVSLAV